MRAAVGAAWLALALLAWPLPALAQPALDDPGEVLARLPGRAPSTDGHLLAYVDAHGALRVLDAWSGSSSTVETGASIVDDVRLAGGWLAYLASPPDQGRAALMAGPLAGPLQAVRPDAGQLAPAVAADGGLAWLDLAEEGADVWRQAPGGRPQAVTNDAAGQGEPAVAPGWVAWTDARNTSPLLVPAVAPGGRSLAAHPSNLDIYVHNATTGLSLQLTDEPLEQIHPTFAAGRVVYLSQEGDGYAAFHRDPAQGIRHGRVALGDRAWRPFLLDGDGGRVVLLEGTQAAATLRVLDVASGAHLGDVPGLKDVLRLEAADGLAAVEGVGADGAREVLLIRLPSPLQAHVLPDGPGCWRVTASGAPAAPWQRQVVHEADNGSRSRIPLATEGARICAVGTVRIVDADGASAAVPLRAPERGQGAPGAPAALLVACVAAVAYLRRR